MTKYCYLLKTGHIAVFNEKPINFTLTMIMSLEIWNNDMTRLVSSGQGGFSVDDIVAMWTYEKI